MLYSIATASTQMTFALTILFLLSGLSVSTSHSDPLRDQQKSGGRFCRTFAGSSNGAECSIGEPVMTKNTESSQPPEGLCLEKLDNGAYVNMVPHPDGSNRVFLSNQQGLVWLATVPVQGSNKILEIVESVPFLDITSHVVQDAESGLMGMAFHPNFEQNGRFFLSYICDKTKQVECSGRCLCNTDVNCDPSKLNADAGVLPCQYQSIIAEFTGNHTGSQSSFYLHQPISFSPGSNRRIVTMGLPSKGDHGGQILFGPDGYLYFMMGDSSREDDVYTFAQNKKSLLGKIMRLDIDHIPSAAEIYDRGLWGNYSIPRDNPYANDTELAPEIWAMGFRNPWRCSFDSERPSYFLCGDCGQDEYEEVDRVIKGGNYGWRVYEGPYLSHPATSNSSINTIFPVMGYNHSETDKNIGSASIIGGYFYRSITDPCLYGRYIYMDLYGSAWAGTENPENSGNFSSRKMYYKCADDSPIQCSYVEGNSAPAIGYVLSFGEDNVKDVYVLTSTGLYRVVRASRCGYKCSKETREASKTPKPDFSSPVSGILSSRCRSLISLLLLWFVSFMFM